MKVRYYDDLQLPGGWVDSVDKRLGVVEFKYTHARCTLVNRFDVLEFDEWDEWYLLDDKLVRAEDYPWERIWPEAGKGNVA